MPHLSSARPARLLEPLLQKRMPATPSVVKQMSIAIVGGGAIGLSLAWELVQRGHSVCVLDAGAIGGGASWAGAGILPPASTRELTDPYDQLQTLSHQLYPQWVCRNSG